MTELNGYGGALSGDCPWYVERREDNEIFDQLSHGEGCYVLTSHQMGKSSLVVRLMDKFRKNGLNGAAIDLSAFGRHLNASQWYNALSLRVGHELHLEDEFENFWAAHKNLAPFERFYQAIGCVAFRALPGPLSLFVDETDILRSLPFSADEFLSAIHSSAARKGRESPECSRLVFCLFATVAPAALWREARPACPDLGQVFTLQDFEREELCDVIDGLARCLLEKNELPVAAWLSPTKYVLGEILDRVFHWTHGHPYLTQKLACSATHSISSQLCNLHEITAAQCQQFVDCLSERLFTSRNAREQDCHLLWVRRDVMSCGLHLSRVIELLESGGRGKHASFASDAEIEALINSGVLCVRDGNIEIRNRIYERVIDEGWLSFRPRVSERSTESSYRRATALIGNRCATLPLPAASGG